MKIFLLAFLGLCSTAVALAQDSAAPQVGAQSSASWSSLPPAFALLEGTDRMRHFTLAPRPDDRLTLSIAEYDGAVGLRARSVVREVLLPGTSEPLVGGLDVAELPGGDLLVSAAFSVGASHELRLWRLRSAGESGFQVVSRAKFGRARLDATPGEPTSREAEFFMGPKALVGADEVALFVAAQPTGVQVDCSERVIARLALSPDLSRITSASIVARGGDVRLVRGARGLTLSVRQPKDAYEDMHTASIALSRSPDGRTWTPFASAGPAPSVDARYSLTVVGEETWVACATPGESDLSSIFQLDPRTAEWRKGESVVATQAGSAARAPALWFSTRAFTAGRPVVVYVSPLGIASR